MAEATGGTITTDGLYTIHTFKLADSGTKFTVLPGHYGKVRVLVVAGGGGGNGGSAGVNYGDAGAGGTVIENASYSVISQEYTITVGAGGSGVDQSTGGSGGNSVFGTITATGGTGTAFNQRTGGSNANYSGGTGTIDQNGGGGAGAGGNGSEKNGGIGFTSNISGSSVDYAGGGATKGLTGGNGTAIAGGGAFRTNGTDNLGGGGGGGQPGDAGGTGGSGIVIIRYLTGSLTVGGSFLFNLV